MDHQRRAGLALGLDGGAHHLLLVVRPRPRVADLADEAGAHAGVAHAHRHLADDLAHDRVLAAAVHVGGMGGRHVVAGAHDDVEPGRPRDARQRQRIARQADVGRIDDRLPAHATEEHDLVLRGLLVEQAEVVEVGVEVLPHPADVGQTDRLIGQSLVAGGRRLAEHHGEVDQQMLVRQRDAHGVGVDGAQHGQRFSGQWARHHVLL